MPIKIQKYDLNIKKILKNWKISDAIREIIANAIDEQTSTSSKEVSILKGDIGWSIKDFGQGISITDFSQNENEEKMSKEGIIGKFGVGLKDAIAVLFRKNIDFKIITNKFTAYPKLEFKEGFDDIKTIHMIIEHTNNNAIIKKGTEFIFANLLDQDVNEAKSNFLIYNSQKIMTENEYGQVLDASNSFIYVDGMKIAESENYMFSYNIKKSNKKLSEKMNRERKSIGQEAYSSLIEKILKNNLSDEMSKLLFDNPDSGEMQKKNIRKEVFKIINKQDKYIFLSEDEFSTLDANQLEIYKILGKDIKIIKDGDANFLDSLYNNNSAYEEYNYSFDFKIIHEKHMTNIQKKHFNESSKILKTLDKSLKLEIVEKNNPLHEDTLGYWTISNPKTIYITLSTLNIWRLTIITILHEYAHSIQGNHDNTREFESDLENVWFKYSKMKQKFKKPKRNKKQVIK